MRLSLAAVLATWAAALVEATERGAAERALIWSAYLVEEAYTDSSKFTIAHGCTGTRTGLRGQALRCNFVELLEHIWTRTPNGANPDGTTAYLDSHYPVREDVLWGQKDHPPSTFLDRDPVTIAKSVYDTKAKGAQQKKQKINPATKRPYDPPQFEPKLGSDGQPLYRPGPALRPGYTGAFLIQNVVKGETNHYEGMSKIGDRIAAAKAEIDKMPNGDAKDKLTTWHTRTTAAVNYVYDLRDKDGEAYKLGKQGAGLGNINNLYVARMPKTPMTPGVPPYDVLNEPGTINDSTNKATFGSAEGVKTRLDQAIAALHEADGGAHKSMMDAIVKIQNSISSGSASC